MPPETHSTSTDQYTAQLEELLAESEAAALQRERNTFDYLVQERGDRIVLFGAGGFGRKTLAIMRHAGLEPLAFAESNSRLWGTSVDQVPVYSPAQAAERFGQTASFLVTIWGSRAHDRMSDRIRQLKSLSCDCVLPGAFLFWKYPEHSLPYYPMDLPHKVLPCAAEVKAAFRLFLDEASRREYAAQIAFRLLLDYDGLGWPDDVEHYFPPDLMTIGPHETFVDCGAFDGDTLNAFVQAQGGSFDAVVAFEPDPLNWDKLQKRIEQMPDPVRRKIISFPYALSSQREIVCFDAAGTDQSRMGSGKIPVQCVTLDEALRDLTPTLIKFDIEGAEPAALDGASKVISRCRPALAVSVYHEQDHLWKIPLKLAMTCPDYRFFLRPHGVEGWDLICYAIPSERLNSALPA